MMIDVFREMFAARSAATVKRAADGAAQVIETVIARRGAMTLSLWLHFFRATKRLRKQIEARALPLAQAGDLPGWTAVQAESRTLDPAVVYQVLCTAHGAEVAGAACPRTTAQAKVRAALRTVAPKGGLERLFDEALAAAASEGGVKVRSSWQLVEEGRAAGEGEGESDG